MASASPVIPSYIQQFQAISATALMEREFPEPKWAIPGILPEGLSILAAKPKKGKSLLALNIALAIASGGLALGKIPVEQGSVLYLALEDTQRRLQERMEVMLQDNKPPEGLSFITQISRLCQGGEMKLLQEMYSRQDLRLVIIDTWAKFNAVTGNSGSYLEDYRQISFMKQVADRSGVPILLIHHQRKMEAQDIMDTLLGSQGLTGAADTVLVLASGITGQGLSYAALHVTGRDVDSDSYALNFDKDTLSWTLTEELQEMELPEKQRKVVDACKQATGPLTPKQMADVSKLPIYTVKKILVKLIKKGQMKKLDHGQYTLNDMEQ